MQPNNWYIVKPLSDSVKMIREPLSRLIPDYLTQWLNLFVITDKNDSLIIDTSCGIFSYKAFLRSVFHKRDMIFMPLTTHNHFDHVGSLHEFTQSLIHPDEISKLLEDEDLNYIKKDIELRKDPVMDNLPEVYKRRKVSEKKFLSVQDYEWLQVGNKELQILHLPGHSSGSLGVFYPDEKMIFTGDAFQTGYVFANEDPKTFKKSIEKLNEFIGREQILLMPSHERIWLKSQTLSELLEMFDNYFSNNIENKHLTRIENKYLENPVYNGDVFKIILPNIE